MMRWILVDTETGGFDPTKHGVCEIAWVEIDEDFNILDRFESLVDPESPISDGAAGVHGITDDKVTDAPTLAEVMTVLRSLPWDPGPIVFIAHNAKFDYSFLREWLPDDTTIMCTLRLARQLYPSAENHKMQTLRVTLDLGMSRGDSHSAGGDVDVLVKMLKRMRDDSGLDLPGLLELSRKNIKVDKIGFGKHKGTKLAVLPRDYVAWLLGPKGPENLDPDLKAALLAL